MAKQFILLSKDWYVRTCLLNFSLTKISTGKPFSEALILVSTNPQYDKILFIELRVQDMKTTSLEHVVYINCSECQYKNKKKQFVYTTCSKLVVFMCWTCKSMNTLLSCSGLVAARISAFRFDTRTKNIVCKKKIKKHSVTRIRPFLSAQSK